MQKIFLSCAMAICISTWSARADTPATAPASKPAEPALMKLPAEAKTGHDELAKWVNSFLARKEEEIVREFGPTKRVIGNDGDPILHYKIGDRSTLTLYINSRGRVVLASYGLMSD
jgi:hypothetical protein